MRAYLGIAFACAGCIDPFHGSNVQFDFSTGMYEQASPSSTTLKPDELPNATHYTFYAIKSDSSASYLFAVQQLEIHRIVDLASPCFIDVGEHVPFPGLHVSQYAAQIQMQTGITDPANPPANATEDQKIAVATALTRMAEIQALGGDMGIKVVTSASSAQYPAMAPDCVSDQGIPPPQCVTDERNKRRLEMCQQFWHDNKDYFEGTDRVLTQPLNGTTHGFVDGSNPVNFAPVGGAQFFVTTDLGGVDQFALYYEDDFTSDPGTLLMYGSAAMPTRGVVHVHMATSGGAPPTGDVAIFTDVDQDNTQF